MFENLAIQENLSHGLAGLGALGVALQNYPAVVLFLQEITANIFPPSRLIDIIIKLIAFGAGAVCGGWVNLQINIDLLDDFFKPEEEPFELSNDQKIKYYAGIGIFMVTGILFGLMAFTFTMEGPLAMLSIAAGIFVAAIMTIQEVQTWITGFKQEENIEKEELSYAQIFGQSIGHLIAIGNVFALSLLFTLSLAQSLMLLSCTAAMAFSIGGLIAFSFGAFTEFYFYDFYLSNFCKNFEEKWDSVMNHPSRNLGLFCVTTNGFVNAALTYAGVVLLSHLLISHQLLLMPAMCIPVIAALSGFFAGSASFILGLDFWIKQGVESNPIIENHNSLEQISAVSFGC